jgi:hypothetical protein
MAKNDSAPPRVPIFAVESNTDTPTYVAASNPERTAVAMSTGIDQGVLSIDLPKTRLFTTSVGMPRRKYVAIAASAATVKCQLVHWRSGDTYVVITELTDTSYTPRGIRQRIPRMLKIPQGV